MHAILRIQRLVMPLPESRANILASFSTRWCPPRTIPLRTFATILVTISQIPQVQHVHAIPTFVKGYVPAFAAASEPLSSLCMPLYGITASLNLRTIFLIDRLPSLLSIKASWDALAFSLCAPHASLLAHSLDDSFAEDEAIIATFLKALGPLDVCHIDPLPPTNQECSTEQTPTSTMQTPASITDKSATLTTDAVATIYTIVINGFVTTHLKNTQQRDVLAITNHLPLHIVWYGNCMPSHTTALSSPFHDTTVFISLLAADRESTSYPPAIGDLNTHPHTRTSHGALLLSADYYKWPCGPMRWKLLYIAILALVVTASSPFACAVPISSNQGGSFFTPDKVHYNLRTNVYCPCDY
ncbi:hypothetical protein KP509_19G011700 [Ceratopteris richardii]|uniref:Uncharacterized protein n=1 Tax=Ceratopteris richardii TaxID=49495 RepID=A0A8T2SI34_CERRI|nr:hypothetical protein KP509_19G011700 [Ceratopteris richardii]